MRGPQARGNPRNRAVSTIGSPSKIEGIATPVCALVRNDVFFFRLLSGAALAHRTRRNAGDGVPYGDLCRDTPPGVSGLHRQKKDQVQFSESLRGGQRPTWQSVLFSKDDRRLVRRDDFSELRILPLCAVGAYTKSMYFVENEQRDGNHLYLTG